MLIIFILASAGCQRKSGGKGLVAPPEPPESAVQRYEYAQLHMGVQTRLIVYAPSEEIAQKACRAAYDRIAALEQIMSDYRPDSAIMRLCAQPAGQAVPVSDELFFVLSRAQTLSSRTAGAFDVTVGPLVQLWRAARTSGELPPRSAIDQALQRVGWRHMNIDPDMKTVTLAKPDMRLDLGGIAKGYAGDEAIDVLESFGVNRALFEAGGDIVVGDAPPGTDGWPIEIWEGEGKPARKIVLENAAVSTSGATEQFVTIDGITYSHVVDPRTGVGLTNQYMATVIASDGIISDSLSTAMTIIGPEAAKHLAEQYPGVRFYMRKVL